MLFSRLFSGEKKNRDGFVRIAASKKTRIREELRNFGMPAEAVYPDLTEVCECIADKFKEVTKWQTR